MSDDWLPFEMELAEFQKANQTFDPPWTVPEIFFKAAQILKEVRQMQPPDQSSAWYNVLFNFLLALSDGPDGYWFAIWIEEKGLEGGKWYTKMSDYILSHILIPVRMLGCIPVPDIIYIPLEGGEHHFTEHLASAMERDGGRCLLSGVYDSEYLDAFKPLRSAERLRHTNNRCVEIIPLQGSPFGTKFQELSEFRGLRCANEKFEMVGEYACNDYEEGAARFARAAKFFFPGLPLTPKEYSKPHYFYLRNVITLDSRLGDAFNALCCTILPENGADGSSNYYRGRTWYNGDEKKWNEFYRLIDPRQEVNRQGSKYVVIRGYETPHPLFLRAHAAVARTWWGIGGEDIYCGRKYRYY